MAVERDYYTILGLQRDASRNQVRTAFKTLALKYHPDINKSTEAELRTKEIINAYKVLYNSKTRNIYDRYGNEKYNELFSQTEDEPEDLGAKQYTQQRKFNKREFRKEFLSAIADSERDPEIKFRFSVWQLEQIRPICEYIFLENNWIISDFMLGFTYELTEYKLSDKQFAEMVSGLNYIKANGGRISFIGRPIVVLYSLNLEQEFKELVLKTIIELTKPTIKSLHAINELVEIIKLGVWNFKDLKNNYLPLVQITNMNSIPSDRDYERQQNNDVIYLVNTNQYSGETLVKRSSDYSDKYPIRDALLFDQMKKRGCNPQIVTDDQRVCVAISDKTGKPNISTEQKDEITGLDVLQKEHQTTALTLDNDVNLIFETVIVQISPKKSRRICTKIRSGIRSKKHLIYCFINFPDDGSKQCDYYFIPSTLIRRHQKESKQLVRSPRFKEKYFYIHNPRLSPSEGIVITGIDQFKNNWNFIPISKG